MRKHFFTTIFLTFLLTGTLDAIAAVLLNHKVPIETVFRYIASGVYGKAAFTVGGKGMMVYGIAFHYMIAYLFTAVWFIGFPWFNKLIKNKFVTGVVYGIITWLIMNFIVVPLSKTPKAKAPMTLTGASIGIVTLVICIGLPVTLIAAWYYQSNGKRLRPAGGKK